MTIDDLLRGKANSIQLIFHALRDKMLSASPRIVEELIGGSKVKMAYYGLGERNNPVGVIGPADDHVKLYIHHFDQVDTGDLQLEGSGKHARHIKLTSEDDLSDIGRLLQEVAKVSEQKIND